MILLNTVQGSRGTMNKLTVPRYPCISTTLTDDDAKNLLSNIQLEKIEKTRRMVGSYSHNIQGEFEFNESSIRFVRQELIPKEDDNFHLSVCIFLFYGFINCSVMIIDNFI